MKKLTYLAYPLIVIASLVAASTAFAGPSAAGEVLPADVAPAAFTSTQTRAQVQAELFRARAEGSVSVGEISYVPPVAFKSLKTRAEVRAEIDTRFDRAFYSEDSGSFALARTPAVRQAAPVYAGTTPRIQ